MAVEAQQLSPEEKLLKVIQSGGEAEKRTSPEEQLLSAVKPQAAPAPVILPPKINPAAAVPMAPAAVKPAPATVVVPQRPAEKPAAVAAKAGPPPVAQRAEVGGQRTEVGGQRSEVRSQKAEVVAAPAAVKPVPVTPKKPDVEVKPPVPAKSAEPKKTVEAKPPVPAKSAEPKKAAEAKLKVLKSEPVSPEKEAPAKTLIGTPGSSDIGGSVEACGTGRSGRKFTMGAVNRGLAAAVLLILAFTVYEIWAAAKMAEIRDQRSEIRGQRSESGGQSGEGSVVEAGSPADLPELASYVEPWKDKDIFFQPDIGPGIDPKSLPPPPDWTTQLKLMGFVGQKAIVRDTKSDTIFIQGPAEKIFIGKCTLELVQIHGDYVVFSDGRNSYSVR